MKPAKHLHAVPKDAPEPPIDITLALRADIKARDWSACHIAADKRRPIFLPANWRAPR